jgi:hypothetical protein
MYSKRRDKMNRPDRFLNGFTVGISISGSKDLNKYGFGNRHLADVLIELARYFLSCGAVIAYGGDLKYQKLKLNFTEILFDLVKTYNLENRTEAEKVRNYVAYPIYTKISQKERAKVKRTAEIIEIKPPQNLKGNIRSLREMRTVEDQYIFARNLTLMRQKMNDDIDARIILGGQTEYYSGRYPGLAEEAYFALKSNKPVFLIGAFGGCAKVIIRTLKGERPDEFTEEYQLKKKQYADLYKYYNEKAQIDKSIEPINYPLLVRFIKDCNYDGLNNGLTKKENEILFESGDILEIVSLVLKGLKLKK